MNVENLLLYPNCLQITLASIESQPLLQTDPHTLFIHTSTLPSYCVDPFINLTSPVVQLDTVTCDTRVEDSK